MGVSEIKKWTAILVLVGLLMGIGGSYAITKSGQERNEQEIAIVNTKLDKACDEFRTEIAEIKAARHFHDIRLEGRLSRIETQLEHINENLNRLLEQ